MGRKVRDCLTSRNIYIKLNIVTCTVNRFDGHVQVGKGQ